MKSDNKQNRRGKSLFANLSTMKYFVLMIIVFCSFLAVRSISSEFRKINSYRIVKKSSGYFPQVKNGFILKRIVKHSESSFGLYSNKNFEYPKTEDECVSIIQDYDFYVQGQKRMVTIVHDYNISY